MHSPWQAPGTADSDGGAPCVLVAGDDRERLGSLAASLREARWRVIEAASVARVAAHLLEERADDPIDLVVLDGTSRPWVAAAVVTALRAADFDLPILLVLGDEPIMRAELGERHARIVDAPAGVDELRAAVAELLSRAREGAEGRTAAVDRVDVRAPVG